MFVLFLILFLMTAGVAMAEETIETSFTATYTQTSTTEVQITGNAPEGAFATFSNTYSVAYMLIMDKRMTYTISGYDKKTIEAITLSMHSNKDKGSGDLSIKLGDTIIAKIKNRDYPLNGVPFSEWYDSGGYIGYFVDVHVDFIEGVNLSVGTNEDIFITIECKGNNSLYCQSVSITWNNGSYTRDSLTAERFGTICLDKGGVVK